MLWVFGLFCLFTFLWLTLLNLFCTIGFIVVVTGDIYDRMRASRRTKKAMNKIRDLTVKTFYDNACTICTKQFAVEDTVT